MPRPRPPPRRAGAVDVTDHQQGAPRSAFGAPLGAPSLPFTNQPSPTPGGAAAAPRSTWAAERRAQAVSAPRAPLAASPPPSPPVSVSVRQRPPVSASVRNASIAFHDSVISAQPGSCLRSKSVQLQWKELMTAPPPGRGSTSLPGSPRSGNLGSRTPVRKPTPSRTPSPLSSSASGELE